jgi:hypothetical protein
VYIIVGLLAKCAWFLVTWATCWAFHWLNWISFMDLPTAGEFAQFFRGDNMQGAYWSGTIWLLLCNGFAWSVAIQAAAATAPAHKYAAVRMILILLCAIVIVGYAFLIYLHVAHDLSYWWKSAADTLTIVLGTWLGLKEVRKDT